MAIRPIMFTTRLVPEEKTTALRIESSCQNKEIRQQAVHGYTKCNTKLNQEHMCMPLQPIHKSKQLKKKEIALSGKESGETSTDKIRSK